MNIRHHLNGTGDNVASHGHGPARMNGRTRARPLFYSDCIWLEGELVPLEEATGHDGAAVVEGIPCYATERGPGVFRLEAHLQRFLHAVRIAGVLDFRWAMADLRRAVAATVQANSFQSCYIQPALTFAGGEPRLAISAWEWEPLPGDAGPPASFLLSATEAGFDETIHLDAGGCVVSYTGGTLFAVRDGILYTPPRGGLLKAIPRDTALMLAADLGYRVVEERLSREMLAIADELFICSTAAEVAPMREVDFRPVGDGQIGPVSAAIRSLYAATVRGRGARSAGWVEYVMMEPLY